MSIRVDQQLATTAAAALGGRRVDKEIRTRLRGLPVLLQTSGLAATCAFLLAKADRQDDRDPYWATAKILINDAADQVGLAADNDPRRRLELLSAADGQQYLIAETRASMLAMWLARLAEARYEPEPAEQGQA